MTDDNVRYMKLTRTWEITSSMCSMFGFFQFYVPCLNFLEEYRGPDWKPCGPDPGRGPYFLNPRNRPTESSDILVLKIILVLVFIQFWGNNFYFSFSFSFEIILVSISVLILVLK